MWSLFRRNGEFRRLFCSQLVSYAGDWFATVAAIGLLLDATGSDLLASLFWVAQSLPTFLMAPIAGPVADRFDRKKILVVVSFAQAAVALTFLLAGAGLPWMVFVAQGGVTALGAFFGPASQAGVANLVDEEDLPGRHRHDVGHVGGDARRGRRPRCRLHRRCSAATPRSSPTPAASSWPACC